MGELGLDLLTDCRRLRNFAREPRRNLGLALDVPSQLNGGPPFRLQFTLRFCDLRSRIGGRVFETGGLLALASDVGSERLANGTEFRLLLLLERRDFLLGLLD